jgi:hypothetical protein
MASDEHVAAALADFVKEVMRGSRESVGTGRILSLDQEAIRRNSVALFETRRNGMRKSDFDKLSHPVE